MATNQAHHRVLVIGLDSADSVLIERFRAKGELPEIDALMRDGATGAFKGAQGYTAETPWTIALTGCWPATTGYWSPAKYHSDYRVEAVEAYSFEESGPFYDYCGTKTTIALDVPQARLSNKVNGLQILSWGAHSPQGPSESRPKELFESFVAKYGTHPTLHDDDYLIANSAARLSALEEGMREGIRRRTRAALDFMVEKPWDLFVVAYGEPHSAGHGFWHLSQPDHPLFAAYAGFVDHDPLLAVYKAIDQAVGELRRAAPPGTVLVLFSQEGMKVNSADMPSWLYLPELLHRLSFDGHAALAKGKPGAPLPAPTRQPATEWMRALWSLSETQNPLVKLARKAGRLRLSQMAEHLLGAGTGLRHPLDCKVFGYMPQLWYQPLWPKMKAFALPSFSEGNVRLNVARRECQGLVAPEEFGAVCEEIIQAVSELTDARTGKPIMREVLRQRSDAFGNPKGPDADIVFLWQPEPTDVVDSKTYGRIGPAPYRRSGDHYSRGFATIAGPGIAQTTLNDGNLVDLAPTILDLLGVPLPNHFDGHSRVNEFAAKTQLAS